MTDATFDVDHFIALDRLSIRLQLLAGLLLVLIGTLAFWGGAKLILAGSANSPNVDVITKGVGVVIDLVGLFPFNNCWARWERIKTLRAIKLNPGVLDPESVHELIRKLYAKFLGV
jgi:hypothetical protein